MRALLLLLVVCPFWAGATGMIINTATIVNARCATPGWLKPGRPLEVIHTQVKTNCMPGRCSSHTRGGLDASGLQVFAGECAHPVPGQFVPTKRQCKGATVYRFKGRLPRGQTISVRGTRRSAQIRVGGKKRGGCPANAQDQERSRIIRINAPRDAFTMEGETVRLAPAAFGKRLRDEPLYGQWARPIKDMLDGAKRGRRGTVRLEMQVTMRHHRMPPDMGCWIREETKIRAVVMGTDAVLEGVDSRGVSEPITPAPKTCPPLPRWRGPR